MEEYSLISCALGLKVARRMFLMAFLSHTCFSHGLFRIQFFFGGGGGSMNNAIGAERESTDSEVLRIKQRNIQETEVRGIHLIIFLYANKTDFLVLFGVTPTIKYVVRDSSLLSCTFAYYDTLLFRSSWGLAAS